MSFLFVVFSAFFGLAVGQFGPFQRPRPFGPYGNPNLHNSFHRPRPTANNNNINGMNNGNMFGGMGGGSGGMGGGNGGMGVNANMFGNGPVPRGGVCPMLQGVTDMQAFKTSCMMLMQTAPQSAECTPGPWGNQCPSGTKCCPQAVDGQCQLQCMAPIENPMKVGTCPNGFYDKPAPGMGWISGLCFYGKSIGQAWDPECRFDGDCPGNQKCCSPECRFDGDCPGNQKCCSPDVDPQNMFGTCLRKCTDV